jgi:hypothetical protein
VKDGSETCSESEEALPYCKISLIVAESEGHSTCFQCIEGYALQMTNHEHEIQTFECTKTTVANCAVLRSGEVNRCSTCNLGHFTLTKQGLCEPAKAKMGQSGPIVRQLMKVRPKEEKADFAKESMAGLESLQGKREEGANQNDEERDSNSENPSKGQKLDGIPRIDEEEYNVLSAPSQLDSPIPKDQQDPQHPDERKGMPSHIKYIIILGAFLLVVTGLTGLWILHSKEDEESTMSQEMVLTEA